MYETEIHNATCLTCAYYPGDRCVTHSFGKTVVHTDDPTYPHQTCGLGKECAPNRAVGTCYKRWSGAKW